MKGQSPTALVPRASLPLVVRPVRLRLRGQRDSLEGLEPNGRPPAPKPADHAQRRKEEIGNRNTENPRCGEREQAGYMRRRLAVREVVTSACLKVNREPLRRVVSHSPTPERLSSNDYGCDSRVGFRDIRAVEKKCGSRESGHFRGPACAAEGRMRGRSTLELGTIVEPSEAESAGESVSCRLFAG